jgi:cytidylate kinase
MSGTVIAIDGTAASGKGTLARKVAEKLGFAYLDTGKLYRYVGWSVLSQGDDPANEEVAVAFAQSLKGNLQPAMLADPALVSDEAGQAASKVAAIPGVRAALLDYQRDFALNPPAGASGAVLDGRDIGTVICPDASLKLYITAKVEIRAQRRYKELHSSDNSVTYEAVLQDMQERDARDAERATAPMKPADDAIVIDTSEMDIEKVRETAFSCVKETLGIDVL